MNGRKLNVYCIAVMSLVLNRLPSLCEGKQEVDINRITCLQA